MFICTSLNHHCITLHCFAPTKLKQQSYDHLTKLLNIILRHIIGRYRVTSDIYSILSKYFAVLF